MKKIKLLNPIISVGLLATTTMALAGCKPGETKKDDTKKEITATLFESDGVSIQSKVLEKQKDSYITLNVPNNSVIDVKDLIVNVGNKQLTTDADDGYTLVRNVIIIKANAMTGENITLKVVLKDIKDKVFLIEGSDKLVSILYDKTSFKNKELSYVALSLERGTQIKANELVVKVGDKQLNRDKDYVIYYNYIIINPSVMNGDAISLKVTTQNLKIDAKLVDSSTDVFIKNHNLNFEKDSTIWLSIPSGQKVNVNQLVVKVGDNVIPNDPNSGYQYNENSNEVIIKGPAMTGEDVTIKIIAEEVKIGTKLECQTEGVSINNDESELTYKQYSYVTLSIPSGKQIKLDNLEVKVGNKTLTRGTDDGYGVYYDSIIFSPAAMTGEEIKLKVDVEEMTITATLDKESTSDVSIDKVSLKADTDSTISLKIPEHRVIDTSNLVIKMDNAVLEKDKNYTLTNNEITIKASAMTGSAITLKVILKDARTFANSTLEEIIDAIKVFEKSKQDETAMKNLCNVFSDVDYISEISPNIKDRNKKIQAHLANFIGKTNTIKINERDHVIKIIGVKHDPKTSVTEATNYTTFTFELTTLLSDNKGVGLYSDYDTKNHYDYRKSILRKNLNGEDDKATWSDNESEKRTALQMLPKLLQDNIKSVEKKISVSYDYGKTYHTVAYDDKLFPFTTLELGGSDLSVVDGEGETYKYWIDNTKNQARMKKDVVGEKTQPYWTSSPYLPAIDCAYCVIGPQLCYDFRGVWMNNCISFGFCI